MPDDEPAEFETPWRRSLAELETALSAWALARIAEPVVVSNVASPGNGMSSETVLFDVYNVAEGGVDRYVARLAPLPDVYPVFPNYDLELQRKCMDLVRACTDVPAPEVTFFERDPAWLGTPFLVMRRIDGEAPPDIPPYVFGGWVMDASPEQRRGLQDATVSVLARLHEIAPLTHELSFLTLPQHGSSALDQQLGYQRWYYEWARDGVSYPLIERTLAWLVANRPTEGEPVL
ncbi:MAG: phosphotransferase family protein [Acidimicrobiia bacterium]